ncbi:ETS-related transcription factor Elf-4-like [Bolinopsis microptera]|uniref:ETS-related transcription factor Elf-4-like n=1 Tax=Bolinopsis microptera TaxID=2820187 RepID=UPI00307AF6B3
MSQTLTLNSFAAASGAPWNPYPTLEEEEFFTHSQDDQPEHETFCFADQLMDIDFPLLDINTRSPQITLPTVQTPINRKRPTWKLKNALLTEEFLLKKSIKKTISSTPASPDKDGPYIDVLSDSCSSISSESDLSSLSQDSLDSNGSSHTSYNRFLRRSPNWSRPFFSSRDRRESRDSDWRPKKEVKKEGSFVNPREEMNMLRLSCTCQSRNTGKSLHLWEFLLEMLADKRMKSVIAWTGTAREFRVVNSREVAREWGNRKNKPHMNFDKMSRAMRYYYKKNILAHGNKQRLVYSFCQEAICPHYEKIIKLALKTRPQTQGSCPLSPREEPAKVLETAARTWERETSPTALKSSSASSKIKSESEKILTERLCPGRNLRFSVKKPGKQDCFRSCCEGATDNLSRSYPLRGGGEPSRTNKTGQFRPAKNTSVPSNNQPKIKINSNRPNYNDCFKFS